MHPAGHLRGRAPGPVRDGARQLVDDLIRSYLARFPGAEFADQRDALYHRELRTLRWCLSLVDMGLQDEGVPLEVRTRVLRGALQAAAPDPDAAADRVVDLAARVTAVESTAVLRAVDPETRG